MDCCFFCHYACKIIFFAKNLAYVGKKCVPLQVAVHQHRIIKRPRGVFFYAVISKN